MHKRLCALMQASLMAVLLCGQLPLCTAAAETETAAPAGSDAVTATETATVTEAAVTEPVSAEPEEAEPEPEPDTATDVKSPKALQKLDAEALTGKQKPEESEETDPGEDSDEISEEISKDALKLEAVKLKAAETSAALKKMPAAKRAAALKAMEHITYEAEELPEGVALNVDVPEGAFTEEVTLSVRFLTDPEDGTFSEDIIAAAEAQYEEALEACGEDCSVGIELFDLSFLNADGEEIEPALPLTVNLAFPEAEEDVEIIGIRHFTDAEDVSVYEDLDFNAENSDGVTVDYITESCSQFTVTWTSDRKTLNIYYIDDEGRLNRVNPNTPGEQQRRLGDNAVFDLTNWRKDIDDSAANYNGLSYRYVGVLTTGTPPSSSGSNQYLTNCNYVQYFSANLGNLFDGWCYSNDNEVGYLLVYGKLTNWRSFVTNAQSMGNGSQERVNSRDLYLVYYPLMKFHWGVFEDNTYEPKDSGGKDVDGSVVLRSDPYARMSGYWDNPEYKLVICTDPENPEGTELADSITSLTNGYRNHPDDMIYYFVYVKKPIPAPTGLVQDALPFIILLSAAFIAAMPSAVCGYRRRKEVMCRETHTPF